ncbi:MAG: cytochrome c5 family protein [Paraburkholderia sp.]|uniref:C-type cytochrome n=1 Tax=Paraburkholderia denitrificans TaxID=694025 RepID=A0ABW0JB69_9BURK|nr:c-type cytochrome [Paraburkholderia sp.]TAM04442.1 MAG: cytochrome c5 family protein [Paraburkholderia sp.]
MKTRNLMLVGLGFALTLGLSACGKSDDASQSASAASAAVAPVASVAVEASAPAAAPAAAAASDAAPAAAVATAAAGGDNSAVGEKTFKGTCFMCHQTGAAGAPMFGNKADWAPRIAKGKDTLYKHALEGFTGNNGTMPAHGGNPSLKDDEVKAAVDYMVAKAQ